MNKDDINLLIEKGKKFLDSANLLFQSGDFDSTASRCYYAMFYMVEALFITKNLKPKSHPGSITLFGEYFVKTKIFPKEMGRQLNRAFDKRQIGDYGFAISILRNDAGELLKVSKAFCQTILDYLTKEEYI